MDDPAVEIELAGVVPKSEGFEVAFPKEKPESPWVCPVETALDVDG